MMKFVLFLGVASLAAAQNLSGEPACATPCLSTAIAAVCTPASDQGCACASQSAIANSAVSCLLASCNSTDLIQAQSAGTALCVAYSATASGSSGSSTASETGSSTTTTSGATATVATTTTNSDGSSITSVATLTGTAASSVSASASSAASSASSSAAAGLGQGSVAAGAGVVGLIMAGLMAL
ncbi:hypothetical protein BD289DRAFT_231210 [Coniella lustricola]|uniref:CFEM domain-containing protein n=1 Tax=Coniella lustricola TaxID=2025994 RepID=A0A2T3AA24_9PEZI|nr:hypothetical protein BD289DRAFT_231210 [Coniella lustricola]